MIWEHLKAIVWLRWRLSVNQWRRAGALSAVLMIVVVIASLITSIPLLIGSYALGVHLIPRAAPVDLMYAWDALIVAFLFFWCLGVLIELQRTEGLSLSKLMHLPISPNGAFLVNYLGSLLRLSLVVFGPLMLGFAAALVAVKGSSMILVLPLLAAFLLMVTALTYQFQGWLAALMSNPRRRRTVVVTITLGFILTTQLPNLLSAFGPWSAGNQIEHSQAYMIQIKTIQADYEAKKFDPYEYQRRLQQAGEAYKRDGERENRESVYRMKRLARLANLILPIGWLPLGVLTAAEERIMPSALGLLGLNLIGVVSLSRAYRTTLGQYQGASSRRGARQAVPAPVITRGPRATMMLEARVPGLSEPVSAVALAGLRSLLRAPEAKMMLLSPLMVGIVLGSSIWNTRHLIPDAFRPMVALGAMGFLLLGLLQLMGNQFGFDRDGFRVFVLSAMPRRDLLVGKNLAFAPLILIPALVALVAVQAICPMRIEMFVAMIPQYLTMYLMFCLLANLMSILTPIHVAAGSMKASSPKLSTVLLQMVMFLVLYPLSQAPVLLPQGADAVWRLLGGSAAVPVALLSAVGEFAVVLLIYRLGVAWEGELLQAREQRVLETVTSRAA